MRILVDGYNLIAQLWGMGNDRRELARQRDALVAYLGEYHALRGNSVHVVFDGWREGDPLGGRDQAHGVLVTYSPLKVTADEVIRDLLAERGPGTLVVSGDRRVQGWARDAGAEAVEPAVFAARVAEARQELPDAREDGDDNRWDGSTVKKGNPRRLSRRERALHNRLNKL